MEGYAMSNPQHKFDPAMLDCMAHLARINSNVLHMTSSMEATSEKQRKALRNIEMLVQDTPANLDEARERMQQVLNEIECVLGGPLAKDVV